MTNEKQEVRRSISGALANWAVVALFLIVVIGVFRQQIGAAVAPLLGYANTTISKPQAQPNTAPQSNAPAVPTADVQQRLDKLYATPVPDVDPTDAAASQISQPDDYQEMTKPSTRALPPIQQEIPVVGQAAPQRVDESPAVVNEGSKAARHKLP